MRILTSVMLLLALGLSGCARNKAVFQPMNPQTSARPAAPATSGSATNQGPAVAPQPALVGSVMRINEAGKFVVLNFPPGKMAAIDQHLYLYRRGQKVGEVKVSGPQREANIVADLVAGDAEVGDEARSQ